MKTLTLNKENLEKALEVFGLDKTLLQENPFLKKEELVKSNENNLEKALANSDDLMKALEVSKNIDLFNKSWGEKTEELTKGLTSISENYINIKKELTEKDSLIKSLTEKVTNYENDLKSLVSKVDLIGNTPNLRKSITNTSYVDRNFQQEDIKKSETGENVLSLNKDLPKIRKVIENQLDNELKKGIDNGPFLTGSQYFDATKKLTPAIIAELSKEGIKIVD